MQKRTFPACSGDALLCELTYRPEDQIASALLAADCDQALDTLMTAVCRPTAGHGHDDMALLLLEYGAYPHSSANEQLHPRSCQEPVPAEGGA